VDRVADVVSDWHFFLHGRLGISTKTKKWIALWVSFVLGISFYTADWVFDIKLLIEYSTKGEWWYFGLTFVFVFVPAVLISWCINCKYYAKKERANRQLRQNNATREIADPIWMDCIRLPSCICLISPIAK